MTECSFEGCSKPLKCSGWCSGHYEQHRKGATLKPLRPRSWAGLSCHCGQPIKAKGLCQKHYDLTRTNRQGTLEQRRSRILRFHYGMTLDEYNKMHRDQDGLCAICHNPESAQNAGIVKNLAVDHDHATNRIRSLLCQNCNTAVGLLKDDPKLAEKVADYLREWGK